MFGRCHAREEAPGAAAAGARRRISVANVGLFAALFPLVLGSCGFTSSYVAEDGGTTSVPVTGTPLVVVDTFNGSVHVAVGPAGSIGVEWTRRGSSTTSMEDAKADLVHLEATARRAEDEDAVRVVGRRTDGRSAESSGVTFTLTVPRGCPVTLASSNGGLFVKGVGGAVTATTSNGRVSVSDAKGKVLLTTSNGGVEAGGEAVVLALRSSNGSLSFSGSLADGSHTAATSNGGIDVTLPKDARFALDAKTSNGRVTSDFPLAAKGEEERTHLVGTVGESPKARLAIETKNGSVHVRRAP